MLKYQDKRGILPLKMRYETAKLFLDSPLVIDRGRYIQDGQGTAHFLFSFFAVHPQYTGLNVSKSAKVL